MLDYVDRGQDNLKASLIRRESQISTTQQNSERHESLIRSMKSVKSNQGETKLFEEYSVDLEYKTTPYRWLILLFYSLCTIQICSVSISFSPVASDIALAYNTSTLIVNLCALIFGATYVPFSFITIKLFTTLSAATTLRIGAFILLAGCWIRSLVMLNNDFLYVFAGMAFLSCSFPVFLSANTLICNRWFADHERALATALSALSVPVGSLLSFALSGVDFANATISEDTLTPDNIKSVQDALQTLLWQQNILGTVSCVGLILFIRNKPKIPPSEVAQSEETTEQEPFCVMMMEALKNKNYTLALICFGLVNGLFVAFGRILSQLFTPFGFSSSYISLIGGIFVIIGILSSLIAGKLLDLTKKYLLLFRLICFGSTITIVCLTVLIHTENAYIVGSFVLLIGIFVVPMIPVGIAFSAELTFPLDATVTNGILQMVGQFSGFVLGLACACVPQDSEIIAYYVFAVTAAISAIISLFINEDLRRANFQTPQSSRRKVALDTNTTETTNNGRTYTSKFGADKMSDIKDLEVEEI